MGTVLIEIREGRAIALLGQQDLNPALDLIGFEIHFPLWLPREPPVQPTEILANLSGRVALATRRTPFGVIHGYPPLKTFS